MRNEAKLYTNRTNGHGSGCVIGYLRRNHPVAASGSIPNHKGRDTSRPATNSLRKKLADAYGREMDRAGFEREGLPADESPDGKARLVAILRRMADESDGEVDLDELPALYCEFGDDGDLPEDCRAILREIVPLKRKTDPLPDVAYVMRPDHTIRKTLIPTSDFDDLVELDRRLNERDGELTDAGKTGALKRKGGDFEELEGLTGEKRAKTLKQIGLRLMERKKEDGHVRFYSPPLNVEID